ncbi:MAG: hypothetical protein Q9167_004477 [Letrouitia subvulpina]
MPHSTFPSPSSPQFSTSSLSSANRPQPRTYSPASSARIAIKNRRKTYLDTHPEYFASPHLEILEPRAHERLVRRFLSPKEREVAAHQRRRDWTVTAAALEGFLCRDDGGEREGRRTLEAAAGESEEGEGLEEAGDKDEGERRWRAVVEARFLRGDDSEFDYTPVDEEEREEGKERDEEEKWFDEELESWDGAGREGDTGVQDY